MKNICSREASSLDAQKLAEPLKRAKVPLSKNSHLIYIYIYMYIYIYNTQNTKHKTQNTKHKTQFYTIRDLEKGQKLPPIRKGDRPSYVRHRALL
jgi:hypothetical protein